MMVGCWGFTTVGTREAVTKTIDTTVGVGHSRRYCNTGYDQSQGRRPSTLKCIGPISKGDISPTIRQKLIRIRTASRSRSDGHFRRFVQYRVDQSQGQRPRSRLVNKAFFQVSGQDQDFGIQVSSKTKTFPTNVSRQDQDWHYGLEQDRDFPPKSLETRARPCFQ